jgi:5-methylcytosine-specific restriction protein A
MKTAGPRLRTVDGRRVKPPEKTADQHYLTQDHRQWRAEVLRRAMFCCQWPGCAETAFTCRLYADHIVELKDGGDPLDPANGQALCPTHHGVKTMAERARRAGIA